MESEQESKKETLKNSERIFGELGNQRFPVSQKSKGFLRMPKNSKNFSSTKKELFAALDKLTREINSSRDELNKLNDQKETAFKKKEDISTTIRKNIAAINESRKKRDDLTKKVKALKEKRQALNKELRKDISRLKELKDEISALSKVKETRRFSGSSKIKDPIRIKGDIDNIEVKLETEAMPFEKEKELSKKLKLLKKSLGEASLILNNFDKIKKLNSETNLARKNTDETHNEIQKLAAESQKLHENLIKLSKETDLLKEKEGMAFRIFAELKRNFNNANNELKEKLSQMNEIRPKINKFKLEEDEKRKIKETILIKSKEQEIEEKIKEGKKLTTEDFLAFQESIREK